MSRLYIVTLLINFYAEYIMRNAGLEEAQAGTKITGRNINNLRYADDTTFMSESEKQLKSLWWNERGEWKASLKFNIQEMKIMALGPITSWQIDGKQWQTLLLGAPQSLQKVTAAMKLKDACPVEDNYDQPI